MSEQDGLWLGRSRQDIEAIALENGDGRWAQPIEIERTDSDLGSYDGNVEELHRKLDGLLSLFGIEPSSWAEHALALEKDNIWYHPPETKEEIQRYAAANPEKSLGQALTNWAVHNLDLEHEQDGYGTLTLGLGLSDLVVVEIQGEGDHWSAHHYRDPESEKTINTAWDAKRIAELEEKLGYDEVGKLETDFEVAYSLTYKAKFFSATPG